MPEYGLVHLLDLQEEQLEIIEMLLGNGQPGSRARRVGDLEHAGGQPADLDPARGQGLRARRPTPCSRPGDEVLAVLDPGLEEELKLFFGPDGCAAADGSSSC